MCMDRTLDRLRRNPCNVGFDDLRRVCVTTTLESLGREAAMLSTVCPGMAGRW